MAKSFAPLLKAMAKLFAPLLKAMVKSFAPLLKAMAKSFARLLNTEDGYHCISAPTKEYVEHEMGHLMLSAGGCVWM